MGPKPHFSELVKAWVKQQIGNFLGRILLTLINSIAMTFSHGVWDFRFEGLGLVWLQATTADIIINLYMTLYCIEALRHIIHSELYSSSVS